LEKSISAKTVEQWKGMNSSNLEVMPCIEFWLKKAAHSKNTRISYLSSFSRFLEATQLDPEAIQTEWQQVKYDYRKKEQFLDRYSDLIEKFYYGELEDLAPKSKATILAAVLSFFQHSKIPLQVDVTTESFVINHNRAITREEVKRILEHANLRDRCFFLMMLESGLRPDTLTKLRFMHISEDFEKATIPMMIKLETTMVKDRVGARFSFIGEDGYRALKEYLSPRLPLKPQDVIFLAVHTKQQKDASLSPALFSVQFGEIIKKLKLSPMQEGRRRRQLTLYTLRKWFRNNIKVSDPAYREFWMTHSLGVDEHYFDHAHHWDSWMEDPVVAQKHRDEYAKAYSSVRIYESEENVEVMDLLKKKDVEIRELKERLDSLQPFITSVENLKKDQDALRQFVGSWLDDNLLNEPAEGHFGAEISTKLSLLLAEALKKALVDLGLKEYSKKRQKP
jgi:integrase